MPSSLGPSTIVFAIATAIPFGLAIKDTATGKYDYPDIDRWADRDYDEDDYNGDVEVDEEALEEYGRQQQELMLRREEQRIAARKEIEAERERVLTQIRGLYGAEIASMGPVLDSVQLGLAKGEIEPSTLRSIGMDAMLFDDNERTYMLYLRVGDSTECDELNYRLKDAWGVHSGTVLHKVWVNEAVGQRAVLDESRSCELKFEKISPLTAWLDKSKDAVVPMAMIGGSAKALTEKLGVRANLPDSGGDNGWFSWTAHGVGVGWGPTTMTAYTKGGKVVGLFASVNVEATTQHAIVSRVNALTGKQPQGEDVLTWKTSPKITIEAGDTQLFLRIGEQTEP